jgi:hypothetical protein
MGILQRKEDRRLVPDPSVVIPNFLFQRDFGGRCWIGVDAVLLPGITLAEGGRGEGWRCRNKIVSGKCHYRRQAGPSYQELGGF